MERQMCVVRFKNTLCGFLPNPQISHDISEWTWWPRSQYFFIFLHVDWNPYHITCVNQRKPLCVDPICRICNEFNPPVLVVFFWGSDQSDRSHRTSSSFKELDFVNLDARLRIQFSFCSKRMLFMFWIQIASFWLAWMVFTIFSFILSKVWQNKWKKHLYMWIIIFPNKI